MKGTSMADLSKPTDLAPLPPAVGSNWLDEVKRDAEYNYKKRLAQQEADREYEASKQAKK
jgi:hypothetical protein